MDKKGLNLAIEEGRGTSVLVLYKEFMVGHIYDIPILPHGPSDKMVWFHNVHGIYTTKSSYSWLLLKSIGGGDETMIHALRNCPKAGDLITGGIDNRLLTKEYELCIDWLEDSIRLLDKKAFEDFISTL
ncbi:hypothetical protein PVK06_039709 [Gossypium arboreum]|uniref:Uncharacterized protein n=1 Tax=Gossypium arboreum TaxID=29729 RepID=A0ABR0N5R8_GOSAR|nr:hypothetical protein PVK06_039709 [Gossypium arboreum]